MTTGILHIASLIYLTLVVCSVYTLSVEAHLEASMVVRSMFKRFLRLAGVLAALAVVVYFLSLV